MTNVDLKLKYLLQSQEFFDEIKSEIFLKYYDESIKSSNANDMMVYFLIECFGVTKVTNILNSEKTKEELSAILTEAVNELKKIYYNDFIVTDDGLFKFVHLKHNDYLTIDDERFKNINKDLKIIDENDRIVSAPVDSKYIKEFSDE